jgi:DnaJ-class molecular chaperone
MRKKGESGDVLVTVKVAVPKGLSPREDELIRELATLRNAKRA